jgi:hypothetical protein
MSNRRRGLIAFACLFLGLAVLQGVLSRPEAGLRQVTLEDGHVLTLMRHDYGSDLVFGSVWEVYAERFLPASWRRSLGLKGPVKRRYSDPVLGLEFHYEGTEKQLGPTLQCSVGDETGFFGGRFNSVAMRGAPDGRGTTIHVVATVLPRRSRTLRIRVYRPDANWDWSEVGEFRIDNPAYGAGFPVWPASPLPVVLKTNDLEITLQRLAFGTGTDRRFVAARSNGENPNGLAAFLVREGGRPTQDWKPDGVEVTDATGNHLAQGSWGSTWRGLTNFFQWSPTLWSGPGGMRFRFEFTRETTAAFTDHERLEIKGLTLPSETGVTELNLITNRLGHRIRIAGIAGKKGRFAGYNRMGGGETTLQVEVEPPLLDKQIDVIAAVDEQGRPVRHGGGSWSRPSGRYAFSLRPDPSVKTVNLTLAVHESVYAEFVVTPEVLAPAAP